MPFSKEQIKFLLITVKLCVQLFQTFYRSIFFIYQFIYITLYVILLETAMGVKVNAQEKPGLEYAQAIAT